MYLVRYINTYIKTKSTFVLLVEYTRVQLHKIEDVEGSDYINANYILVC